MAIIWLINLERIKAMKNNAIITISEIKCLYREYSDKYDLIFSDEQFKEFLKFLEIDFYDWVRENLRQFSRL